jgi:hypothetical protein
VNACPIDRAPKEFHELDQPVSRIQYRQTEITPRIPRFMNGGMSGCDNAERILI